MESKGGRKRAENLPMIFETRNFNFKKMAASGDGLYVTQLW